MRARARNWRLEIVAWLAAIAVIAGALAFSGGGDDDEAAPAAAPRTTVGQPEQPGTPTQPGVTP